jgi:hypothetical protein
VRGSETCKLAYRGAVQVTFLDRVVELETKIFVRLPGTCRGPAADQPSDERAYAQGYENKQQNGRIHDRNSPGTE